MKHWPLMLNLKLSNKIPLARVQQTEQIGPLFIVTVGKNPRVKMLSKFLLVRTVPSNIHIYKFKMCMGYKDKDKEGNVYVGKSRKVKLFKGFKLF